jgi:DNA-cytosine methyltransferase
MLKIRYFSTFSGIGGFELGMPKDWECVGFSEIDKYAIQVYQNHFPTHKNFGDISLIDIPNLPDFDLLVGGSPCQDLSISKKNREGLRGARSGLFHKFVEILRVKKPKYFILENVNSMSKESKAEITKIMGVEPVMINAALVSAQNRKRLFWANFPITQPKDKGILLKDIIESGTVDRLKSYAIDANYWKGGSLKNYLEKKRRQLVLRQSESRLMVTEPIRVGQIGKGGQGDRIYSIEGKSVNLSANGGGRGAKTGLYVIKAASQRGRYLVDGKRKDVKGAKTIQRIEIGGDKANTLTKVQKDSLILENEIVRKLTPIEYARLQCFPDNWCEGISNSQQYKCYGNAVNVEVVKHIISCLKTV